MSFVIYWNSRSLYLLLRVITLFPQLVQICICYTMYTGHHTVFYCYTGLIRFNCIDLRCQIYKFTYCLCCVRHIKSIIALFPKIQFFMFFYNKDRLINVRTFRYKYKVCRKWIQFGYTSNDYRQIHSLLQASKLWAFWTPLLEI